MLQQIGLVSCKFNLQLFVCLTNCLAICFLSPSVVVLTKEPHGFAVKQEQRATCQGYKMLVSPHCNQDCQGLFIEAKLELDQYA